MGRYRVIFSQLKNPIKKMTEKERNELREALIGQRSHVLKDVHRHGSLVGTGVGVIADETERADRIADNVVDHQLGYSESKLLEKIEHALQQIDEGSYGICEDCKKEINIERLKAKPSVSLCISCQTAKEEKG